MTFRGVATRAEVEELSKELERVARRLDRDKSEKVRKARKAAAKRPAAVV